MGDMPGQPLRVVVHYSDGVPAGLGYAAIGIAISFPVPLTGTIFPAHCVSVSLTL
jgi:hypothetical protein